MGSSGELCVRADVMVTVAYRLFDQDGELRDEVSEAEPLSYVHGYAQIIPGLDSGLHGCVVGDHRSLWLDPEEAFGEYHDEARLEIDRHDFPAAKGLKIGDEILAEGPDGSECAYRVLEITRDCILVDLNHPLAGQTIRFDVDVLAVREATEEELAASRKEADEHIVYESTIVYGSHSPSEPLVQLRVPSAGEPTEKNDEKTR